MSRNERGFSLVELMITMVIFVVVIVASSQIFTGLLTQFKQQSTIAETNIEGVVGLDILRRDLAHAGFGLPWNMNGASYLEAAAESGQTFWVDRNLNDGPPDNPARGTDPAGASNPPAVFRSLNNMGIHNGATNAAIPNTVADVLAIKATNVSASDASQRWTFIANRGSWNTIMNWGTGSDAPRDRDYISVISGIESTAGDRMLMWTSGSTWWTTYGGATVTPMPAPNSYDKYVLYGLGNEATPRMPFNRADYYVKRPASGMPSRCAPHTGILYKATLNQSNGIHTEMPLLDCVADFQVEYLLDSDVDTVVNWPPVNDISTLTAAQIRAQLMEVRVYIVAQEGRKDINYDFSNGGTREAVSTVEALSTYNTSGNVINQSQTRTFVNLKNVVGDPEYKYYRWKLYTLIVKPTNLK